MNEKMTQKMTRKEWERYERVERDFHAHPLRYRCRILLLLLEGLAVALLLGAIIAALVWIALADPKGNVRLLGFLVLNIGLTVFLYLKSVLERPWKGLPNLSEREYPNLFALVRETAEVVGAPRIHRICLVPDAFNAAVTVAFPFIPGLRRNILMLGYPLLAAANRRTLRGILTHELGQVAHHDTLLGGALFHLQTFWNVLQLGIFTGLLSPWRKSYLRRLDRLMVPIRRKQELAADRTIAERFGIDTLRETMVMLEFRGTEMEDLSNIVNTAFKDWTPDAPPPGVAAAIRAALRRPLPEEEARRRLDRSLRALVPPMEEHPPLATRVGTGRVEELLPFTASRADALEAIFGSAETLDPLVDATFQPYCVAYVRARRDQQALAARRLADLTAAAPSVDGMIERIQLLQLLERREEADVLLRSARAAYPGSTALETIDLAAQLAHAPSAEAGEPLADRLEELLVAEPMLRIHTEDELMAHYLEVGDAERVKRLLDLGQKSDKAVRKRLGAKLKPTDDLEPLLLSDQTREEISHAFPRRYVRAIYPVQRHHTGTGVAQSYYVIRPGWLSPSASEFAFWGEQVGVNLVLGNRALFRRLEELGIEPIKNEGRKPKAPTSPHGEKND